jgi:Domain of unknown function (DUF4417)
MLMRSPAKGPASKHAPRRIRQLWHDERRNPPALGCQTCPDKTLCGGVCVAAPYFDCLTYCCGKPDKCGSVCPANPHYADRVWEVRTFDLANVPRGPRLDAPELPRVIPILYHGSSRIGVVSPGFAALPLCAMFSRRSGEARFRSATGLMAHYRLAPETQILLTGIGEDVPIERWWGLGMSQRAEVIRTMQRAGACFMTTPNYSLTVNVPRWDDLYAIKRIGLVHSEMIGEGVPTALHVNGRTDTDFKRWAEFIVAREEVTHVAYEFTTGTRWAKRRQDHAVWLCGLARDVGRPLHLIVRGGTDQLGGFRTAFAGVTVLETDSFMWAMKRQEAVLRGNTSIRRRAAPTEKGAPLDELLAGNILTNRSRIENLLATAVTSQSIGRA